MVLGLPALPTTPSGKLDRAALPAPQLETTPSPAQLPPATPTQALLAELWQELLGLSAVGAEDNFFTLGGDSILSLQLVARAARAG